MKLENAAKYKFILEPRYFYFGWSKSPLILGQPELLKALARARKFLPRGYNFKIWDLQRPRYVQLEMLASFRRIFKTQHPKWSRKQLEKAVRGFGALPLRVVRPDTHRNGGAVDLTIVDRNGDELYMGTDHDDLTQKASTDYFKQIKKPNAVEREAAKNRALLKRVLLKAGFENIHWEWWHWSYLPRASKQNLRVRR